MTLSITMPALPIYIKEDYNLGKPETILRITFKEGVHIEEFRNIYMYIYNLMIFLNFRRDISMGDISLGKINEDQKVEEIAYTYFVEPPKNTEFKIDPDNIIGYYFVENNINELLKIVNEPKLNLLFIPKDKKVQGILRQRIIWFVVQVLNLYLIIFFQMQEQNIIKWQMK